MIEIGTEVEAVSSAAKKQSRGKKGFVTDIIPSSSTKGFDVAVRWENGDVYFYCLKKKPDFFGNYLVREVESENDLWE